MPNIVSGMKQHNNQAGRWINASQIGALCQIAPGTTQRKILKTVIAAVLLGPDVLDVMSQL